MVIKNQQVVHESIRTVREVRTAANPVYEGSNQPAGTVEELNWVFEIHRQSSLQSSQLVLR